MIVRATSVYPELMVQAVDTFRGGGDAERFLAAEGTLAFLAVEDARVQGWCWGYHLIRPDASSMAYVHELEVMKAWQRRGIGRQLMESFMASASSLGASKVFLNTGADNLAARSLYERLGGSLAEQGSIVSYWFQLRSGDGGIEGKPGEPE